MNATNLARALGALPDRLPMVINDRAIVAIETATGRIRRDIMGPSFAELPDKPRDTAIVLRPGSGDAITVRDAIAFLCLTDHADLPIFVHGAPVDGVETAQRRLDPVTGLYRTVRGDRLGERVVTPVHWSELSTGEQALSQVWIEQP